MNDIESKLPTAKKSKFEHLKAQLKGMNSSLRSNCMTGKLLLQQPKTQDNENLINSCKKEVENLQKDIFEIEREIIDLKKLHPKLDDPYDFQVPEPRFGQVEKFNFANFLHLGNKFEPGTQSTRVSNLFKSLIPTMNSMALTEEAMKSVVSGFLLGESY